MLQRRGFDGSDQRLVEPENPRQPDRKFVTADNVTTGDMVHPCFPQLNGAEKPVREIIRKCGIAELIVDNAHRLPRLQTLHQPEGKVGFHAGGLPVQHHGAGNYIRYTCTAEHILTGKFCLAIVTQRFGPVIFRIRSVLAVEHIVAGYMDQNGMMLLGCLREVFDPADIDLPGKLPLRFARVDVRHRSTIDDNLRTHFGDKIAHLAVGGDIHLQIRGGVEFPDRCPLNGSEGDVIGCAADELLGHLLSEQSIAADNKYALQCYVHG